MSDSLPSPDFDDELLSAYADGELTDAERAQVEEHLAADPDARQLVEELRAMSATLRAMPREALGRDLRDAVWSEFTSGAPASGEPASAGGASQTILLSTPPTDHWPGFKRGLIWSALAIAAALLLMVFQPHEDKLEKESLAKADRHTDNDANREPQGRAAGSGGGETVVQRQYNEQDKSKIEAASPAATPSPSVLAAGDAAKQNGLPGEQPPASGATFRRLTQDSSASNSSRQQPSTVADDKAVLSSAKTLQLTTSGTKGVERFEKALLDNGIAFSDDPAPTDPMAALQREDAKLADGAETARRLGAAGGSRGALGEEAASSHASAAESPSSGVESAFAPESKTSEPPQKAILVEASRDQIENLLARCRADRQAFAKVPAFNAIAAAKPASAETGGRGFGGGLEDRTKSESPDADAQKDRLALQDKPRAGRSSVPDASAAGSPAASARVADHEAHGQAQSRGRAWRIPVPSHANLDSYARKSVGGRGEGAGPVKLSQLRAENKKSSADGPSLPPREATNEPSDESSDEAPILVLFLLQPGDDGAAR